MDWNRHVMMASKKGRSGDDEKWGWQSVNIIGQIAAVDLECPTYMYLHLNSHEQHI